MAVGKTFYHIRQSTTLLQTNKRLNLKLQVETLKATMQLPEAYETTDTAVPLTATMSIPSRTTS